MTGPVLTYLGTRKLELGPLEDTSPQGQWRAGTDAYGVRWLALDVEGSGTNTVSRAVLEGLDAELDRIEAEQPKGVVIRSAKAGGFAAGADISMFRDMTDRDTARALLERGHAVLDRLEALDIPTICVVHGAALGAGFEIALACDRIIAIDGASFGFPEVNLGLHPGLGGTFRLPARIEPTQAMTLMLTGKTAHTKKARDLGIADAVTEERHVAAAIRDAIDGKMERDGPGLTARAFDFATARDLAARKMRHKAAERAPQHQYPAPHALIDLWDEHGGGAEAMQKGEIRSFADLLSTETSRNLVRVFFLQQTLKQAGRGEDGIAHVHVAGAGIMGAEIAAWCALKGKHVTLSDPDRDALARAVKSAERICKDAHLDSLETRDALDRLVPDPHLYGLRHADLVIEAGPEDLKIKAQIYAQVEAAMQPSATLATNTSSLPLAELAQHVKRPSRLAGLHFFNPVSKMQLVEVVSHDDTFQTVTDQLAAFCGAIGRMPARVRDYPGFLVNRALTPYLLEAIALIDEGHDKARIDAAAEAFGMPVGPVELADQVGLDICLHVADSLRGHLEKPMAEIPDWLRKMVEDEGHTGRKSGRGLYEWQDGEAQKPQEADSAGEDVTDRLILPMLDACVECLRRGVVADADTLDGAMIFATGFAPFRGGPLHYARARGPQAIRDRLTELAQDHGPRFAPDPGWEELRPNV